MMSYTRILWTVTVFMSACTAVWAQYRAQVKFLSYNLWGYQCRLADMTQWPPDQEV